MMNATRGVFIQEPLDRAGVTQGVQKLDFRIFKLDKDHSHTMIWFVLRISHLCAERIAILICRSDKVGHGDGHMV